MFYRISRFIALLIFAALIIVPSMVVIFGSFKTDLEIYDRPLLPPIDWTIANYKRLFTDSAIEQNFINSIIVTSFSVVLTLLLASLAAFGIARMVNITGKVLFTLFAFGLAIPAATNIIAIFHQWGAIQLILAVLLLVLFFRYPGLTPLILLTLILDPILRFVAGQQMSLTTTGTPPGEALNGVSLYLLLVLFLASLWSKKTN